ncbi:MAG TPA: hypothetical protein VMN60_13390, partial [Longimicrobiales bacterium]|nr:hypothetical protein [Longimicrobiales bacterium]
MNALRVAAAVIALLLHMLVAFALTGAFWSAISAGAALGAWPVVWLVPLVGLLALLILWIRAARRAGALGAALGTLALSASVVALLIALSYGVYLMFG